MKTFVSKRSQALLDFVLIFGVLLALMAGLVRIWVWFDANFAKRNVDYQNERLKAGQAAYGGGINYSDQPLTINDDWVFKGKPTEKIDAAPIIPFTVITALGGGENSGSALVCESARNAATALRTEGKNMKGQAKQIRKFTDWGDDWYDPLRYLFLAIGIDVDGMVDAAEALEKNAKLVNKKADEIECIACGSLSIAPYTCS